MPCFFPKTRSDHKILITSPDYVCVCVYVCLYMCLCMSMCARVCSSVCMCASVCVCTCVYVCMYMCVSDRAFVLVCMYVIGEGPL